MNESEIKSTQAQWRYRGKQRPPFALIPSERQESVWDYPRPPAVEDSNATVIVRANNVAIVAQSSRAKRVLETASPPTWYIPAADVNWAYLESSNESSFCEWKGKASYFALASGGQPVAWVYPAPRAEFAELAGYVAFYPARVACFVNNERVRPQPSEFYGGWITDNIVGPFKGDAGTSGW
ncbi:hypothetical protein HK100_000303 [Physocladia obscura]|uniref:DUF427 domain-containing protein n=1 Tax=Physocladia obscura TaxID=109957 RepID=A0AAD5XFP6_9FUNG|nr:hypothetical protein HK100_000303 [Physocladia obscura]